MMDKIYKKYFFRAYCNLTRTLIILHSAGFAGVVSFIGITMTKLPVTHAFLDNLKCSLSYFLLGLFFSLIEAVAEYISYFFYPTFNIETTPSSKPVKIFYFVQLFLIAASLFCLIRGGYLAFINQLHIAYEICDKCGK